MILKQVLLTVDARLRRLAHPWVFLIALAGIVIVGVPDYFVGAEISMSIFYLGPVGLATWYADFSSGSLIALLSTLAAFIGNVSEANFATRPGIAVWNALLHLGFMLVVAYLLNALRMHLRAEQQLARTDPLTGVCNRRAFMERLQYILDLARREGWPVTLTYIDLDDFKRINDEQGHEEGDRLLRAIAKGLSDSARRTDVVARLGGDEFALLVPDASRGVAEKLMKKTRDRLCRAAEAGRWPVTCSIGCVTFSHPPPDADSAIRAADALMYSVKSRGKNSVAFEEFAPQPDDWTRHAAASDW